MGRIWKRFGHRPSRIEWEDSNPRISYPTYRRYFGGWENACLRFLEHKMGSQISVKEFIDDGEEEQSTEKTRSIRLRKRDIPLKLRLAVLKRDSFRCVFCGRSPAIHPGVVLHIDHKVPFSKGGDTTIKNLQTLCDKCNLGKGDTHIV